MVEVWTCRRRDRRGLTLYVWIDEGAASCVCYNRDVQSVLGFEDTANGTVEA